MNIRRKRKDFEQTWRRTLKRSLRRRKTGEWRGKGGWYKNLKGDDSGKQLEHEKEVKGRGSYDSK